MAISNFKSVSLRGSGATAAIFIFFLFALTSCASSQERKLNNSVCFATHCYAVELAMTPETMMRGLQNRTTMPVDHGMLFVFPNSDKHSFWMKETLIPLDMIWLDYAKRVVYIAPNVKPCVSDPCPTYTPTQSSMYVLELNAEQAKTIGLSVGDTATFKLNDIPQ